MKVRFLHSAGTSLLCVVILAGVLVAGAHPAAAGFPQECEAGVNTPIKFNDRTKLLATAYMKCFGGSFWYLRLKVKLQRKVDGVWRWRASATGAIAQLATKLEVQVWAPCLEGRHRTFAVHRFRQNPADPWQVLRWHSPSADIWNCNA